MTRSPRKKLRRKNQKEEEEFPRIAISEKAPREDLLLSEEMFCWEKVLIRYSFLQQALSCKLLIRFIFIPLQPHWDRGNWLGRMTQQGTVLYYTPNQFPWSQEIICVVLTLNLRSFFNFNFNFKLILHGARYYSKARTLSCEWLLRD